MADYAAAQITIGGCLSRRLVPKLCQTIRDEGLSLDWGEADFIPQSAAELLAARQVIDGESVLRLCSDRARYGEFDALETLLIRQQVPFDRQSDGHFEFSPAYVVYRPGTGVQRWVADQGQPLVSAPPLWDWAERFQAVAQRLGKRPRQSAAAELAQLCRSLRELLQERPTPLVGFAIGKPVPLRRAA